MRVWQALTQAHVQAHPCQRPTRQNGAGAEPAGTRGLPAWGSTAQLQQPESPIQPGREWARGQAKDGDLAKHLTKVSGGG